MLLQSQHRPIILSYFFSLLSHTFAFLPHIITLLFHIISFLFHIIITFLFLFFNFNYLSPQLPLIFPPSIGALSIVLEPDTPILRDDGFSKISHYNLYIIANNILYFGRIDYNQLRQS